MSKFKTQKATLYKVELDKGELDKFKPPNAPDNFKVTLVLYNMKNR
jgi:hypothetical protein